MENVKHIMARGLTQHQAEKLLELYRASGLDTGRRPTTDDIIRIFKGGYIIGNTDGLSQARRMLRGEG